MNAELLLKHFDRISEAPDAVERLRGFIFDLAMRGKLLEHNPDDEPAAEALQRAGRKLSPNIRGKHVPLTWVNAPLEALAASTKYPIGDGDHGQIKPACYGDSGIPYIRVADIGWGTFEPNGLVYIPEDVHEQNLKSELVPGDILIAKTGATIGKCCIVPESIPRANTTSSVGKVTIEQGLVLPQWIIYYFLSAGFKAEMWAVSKKTAQPGFNISNLKQFLVPLPPLAEQHRIVAKVNELMGLCDQLRAAQNEREVRRDRLVAASLHRIGTAPDEAQTATVLHQAARFHLDHLPRLTTRPEHIKQLRQAILNLAVRGRLVSQDPNDEPAPELMKRITAENKRLLSTKNIRAQKPSVPTESFEATAVIPASWMHAYLQDLAYQITDGTHLTPKYVEQGKPFLSAQNVKPFKFMPEKHRFVSEADFDKYRSNRRPERGDILMTRVGAGIGEAAVLDSDFEFAFYVSLCLIKIPNQLFSAEYLALWLNSPEGRDSSAIRTYGKGASQGNLNLSLIRTFKIPLPPIAEQHRIVAKVDELMALCDQLEAQLATSEADSSRLLEAVLRDALAA